MPPFPGQPPPEDLQRFMAEQEQQRAHQAAVEHWYQEQLARLEAEHRERMNYWSAIVCNCAAEESVKNCPVHAGVMVTADGRVL